MTWKEEWGGMPEFVQDKKEPYCAIIFRFESEQDLQDFADLVKQKLTKKTKSAWFPHKPHRSEFVNRWVDNKEVV